MMTCCFWLCLVTVIFVHSNQLDSNYVDRNIKKIAFGSCNNLKFPFDYIQTIIGSEPDVWLWKGDIVYGRTKHETDLTNIRKNHLRVVSVNIHHICFVYPHHSSPCTEKSCIISKIIILKCHY